MGTYGQKVEAQRLRNPCLANLSRFLTEPRPLRRRANIRSLDFHADTTTLVERDVPASSLRAELTEHGMAKRPGRLGDERLGQILVIEDLEPSIVETLGDALSIDPIFFASHLDSPLITLEAQPPDLAVLPSRRRPETFANLHYHRTIRFHDTSKFTKSKLLMDGNVERKIVMLAPSSKGFIGLARHCISVYKSEAGSRWIAILLVDAMDTGVYRSESKKTGDTLEMTLTSRPFLGGYEDFLDPLSLEIEERKRTLNRYDLAKDLTNYWLLAFPPTFRVDGPRMSALCHYPLKVAMGEWMCYVAVMHRSIKQFEYNKRYNVSFVEELDKLDDDLQALQSWRRRSMASQQKINALSQLVRAWAKHEGTDDNLSGLQEDLDYISTNLSECGVRLEQMIPLVTSLVQIVDSRRAFAEATNISRLTVLALVFVPVSFVATIFGMDPHYGPGGSQFWVFFAVAIPVTTIVFLIARPPTTVYNAAINLVVRLRSPQTVRRLNSDLSKVSSTQ